MSRWTGGGIAVLEPSDVVHRDGWHEAHWPEDSGRATAVALRLPLTAAAGTRWLRHGWQSWSASGWEVLGAPGPPPSLTGPTTAPRHPWFAGVATGPVGYDVASADGWAITCAHPSSSMLWPRPLLGDVLVVRDAADLDGGRQPPVLWREDLPAADGVVAAVCAAARATPPPASRRLVGWSSWTAFFEHIDGPRLVRQAREAAAWNRSGGRIGVIAVDDGYHRCLGDWTVPRQGFGTTLPALAGSNGDLGLAAGIWLAPALVAPSSRVPADHPDWVLRDDRGAPVVAMSVPMWGGDAWVLDVSRPEVLAHVRGTVAELVAQGWSSLKLDFLYAAGLPGMRAMPTGSSALVRQLLTAIRAAAGDDVHLTACGAPLWPVRGLVDAVRVGPDVLPSWQPTATSGLPARHTACLRSTWRSAHTRRFLHGRLWHNDPDAVMLRTTEDPAAARRLEAWSRWAAGIGGSLLCSDDLTQLDDPARTRWSELVAGRSESDWAPGLDVRVESGSTWGTSPIPALGGRETVVA